MAFHCAELAFVFDNTARCQNMTGDGPRARALAARMSDAWIHFARSGDPNHSGIPKWSAYNANDRPVMHIDNEWKQVNDPDREERLATASLPRLPMF